MKNLNKTALLVIDIQKDYFAGGAYPLWLPEKTVENTLSAMALAQSQGVEIIHVQHIFDTPAPFFNKGTSGIEIDPRILQAAPESSIVVKSFADSFEQTNLDMLLKERGISTLLICGMMTHNCVTHTAISKAAEQYDVTVITDCCTTIDEMVHNIALSGMSNRVPLKTAAEAFSV